MASCYRSQDEGSDVVGIPEEPSVLRCKKCRRSVVDSSCLLSASEDLIAGCTVWHVNIDALPEWMLSVINQVHWTTGKLNCQHCGARLGGFNFLNRSQCPCGRDTTIHLIKSRVDQLVKHHVRLSSPGTARVHTRVQVKHTDLEGPEDMAYVQRQVTHGPNPENELQSRQMQMHLNVEPAVIPPCRCPLSLPLICPVHEEVNDAEANDAHDSTMQSTQTERSDHLPNQDIHPDSLPSPAQDIVIRQENISDGATDETLGHSSSPAVQILTKREKNRLKSLRRKQRKKERWIRRQLEEEKNVSYNQTSSDEEEKEGCMCAVCLDVYYKPYMCQPCSHVFCEPCLRTLAKSRASSTPCPLCRTLISHVIFQQELHQRTRTHFPKEYQIRNENFHKTNYSKWPLPNSPKHFRILWGLQRDRASAGQWQFPLRVWGLELGDMRNWTHSDIIRCIFSFHWVLSSFIVLIGLFYILLL